MKQFYEKNHQQYFNSTVDINPVSFLTPLTHFLDPKATILDIGCGSGRDLLWLQNAGFLPTGFEQSASLANLAKEHSGCLVIESDFCDYDFSQLTFDALVLVGALVHQPRSSMHGIIASITRALKAGGYMLITIKEGTGRSSVADGREFTLWGKDEIEEVYRACGLDLVDFSRQVSRLRPEDIWLGHVLRLGNAS